MVVDRPLITIDDPGDPRIAEFSQIRERDLTGRDGRFIAEGTVVLRMLAAAHASGVGIVAEKILLLRNRVDGVLNLLEKFPADVPVYVADGAVLDAIAGFPLHRGVLALGKRAGGPDMAGLIDSLPQQSLVLVGCGISNHDNIGSMFRNAAAFNADAVLLDATCCDPLYRKALRVSVGSVLTRPYGRGGSILDILEALAAKDFAIWGLSPGGAAEIRDIAAADRMALIVGTEGEGLPDAVLQRFRTARIAQSTGLDSLNAATATGIALYQIAAVQGRI
jgi:tRNA G18 (ribose-2'-O)-methylase SpoU